MLGQAQRDQQEVGPGEESRAAGPEVLHKAQRGSFCSRFLHCMGVFVGGLQYDQACSL